MLAVLAVVLSGVALAPTASAKDTATSTTVAPVPKKWDPRLKPIADKVAELRKLKFEHPVAAEFLDDAAFEKKVAVDHSKLTKEDKESIARSQGQLRAVGLIGPDVDILGAVESLQQSGVLAYYEPKTQLITVKGTDLANVSTARHRCPRAHPRAAGPALRSPEAQQERGEGPRQHRAADAGGGRRGANRERVRGDVVKR